MYASPEDARSDLLLAAAVFVFGPVLLSLLLVVIPLTRIPGMSAVLPVVLPVLVTAAVPVAMMRYRGEGWASIGLGTPRSGLGAGALLALPIVVASILSVVALGGVPTDALPALAFERPGWLLLVLTRLVTWLGLALLVAYVTTKARDAFRLDFSTIPEGMVRIGRILAIVVAVAAGLRLVVIGTLSSVVLPLGVALTVYLVWRGLRGPSSTGFAVLLTPTVLLAIGSFLLSFRLERLVESVWTGAMIAAIGLVMGALRESRRSAWPLVGLALVIALATTLPAPMRLGV